LIRNFGMSHLPARDGTTIPSPHCAGLAVS